MLEKTLHIRDFSIVEVADVEAIWLSIQTIEGKMGEEEGVMLPIKSCCKHLLIQLNVGAKNSNSLSHSSQGRLVTSLH